METRSMKKRRIENVSILQLNDDCLYHIFSFLKLRELIVVDKVCQRFFSTAKMIYRRQRVLNIYEIFHRDKSTLKEAICIIIRILPFIDTFTNTGDYCRRRTQRPRSVAGALPFQHLKVVELENCQITDNTLKSIAPMQQIEVLNVSGNMKFSGECLAEAKNIQEINLSNCDNLNIRRFRRFCENTTNLLSLNIQACRNIDKFSIEAIADLKTMEQLMISDNYKHLSEENILLLADLPNLKHLEISYDFRIMFDEAISMDSFLLRISQFNRLTYLYISEAFLNENLLQVISNLTNLEVLNLDFAAGDVDGALERISSNHKINDLHLEHTNFLPLTLELLIKRNPSISYINCAWCKQLDDGFILKILGYLQGRFSVLKMDVEDTSISQDMYKKINDGRVPSKLKFC